MPGPWVLLAHGVAVAILIFGDCKKNVTGSSQLLQPPKPVSGRCQCIGFNAKSYVKRAQATLAAILRPHVLQKVYRITVPSRQSGPHDSLLSQTAQKMGALSECRISLSVIGSNQWDERTV